MNFGSSLRREKNSITSFNLYKCTAVMKNVPLDQSQEQISNSEILGQKWKNKQNQLVIILHLLLNTVLMIFNMMLCEILPYLLRTLLDLIFAFKPPEVLLSLLVTNDSN